MSRSTPRYHHGDLPAALLARAEQTLRESGVDGLSLRQLARDLDVSHAAPSRHFRDKQALLDALALTGFERLRAIFDTTPAPESFPEGLHAFARKYLDFAVDNPALLSVMFARKHSPTGGTKIAEAANAAFAVPIAQIAAAQAAGEMVVSDPTRIGMSTIAALQGLATFISSGFVAPERADELLTETVTHLIHGLRPRT